MDRSWMDRRVVEGIISDEYREGVEHFCDFVFDNAALLREGRARCPCNRCGNRQMLDRSTITVHLYRNGFMSNYKQWYLHGETWGNVSRVRNEQEMDTDRMVDMVMDAAGPEFNWNTEEDPEAGSSDFYRMMKDADEPLWPGCETHTVLSAVSELLNLKAEFNMTVNCYDRMVAIIKKMLPKDEKLVGSFYASKKMVKGLGMGYEKIDACQNDCMIFYKENQDKSSCGACGANRFKPRQEGRNQKDIPYKVLRYLPITPRLQRLYLSKSTAGHMRWHKQPRKHPDMMCHPSDSEAWKQFDARHPSFVQESRNVRLGLSTDGFTPFGHAAAPYSCWPVFITPYNLPPGMCMKEHNIFLTLVIPGPRHPGRSIDVYLRPLVDELKFLWSDGIRTFDVSKKQNFLMKATLLWTISDFPAYGMLSGWSTHGKLACPHCMESTKSFHLEHGRKPCWFDCHRQFLPEHHPFRKQRDNFRRNKIEKDHAPQRLSGMEVFQRVSQLDEIQFGRQYDKQKSRGFGRTHNWVKQSIFWELPYWITNLIRHNLDVMHIEKNVFDNVFYTVMDVKGKTKDNPKARADMKNICKRPQLELVEVSPNKFIKPKASYTLTRQQIKDVCEWCKSLKFPDGYASNISRCVNVKDCRFYGLKSHDCHIFMQRLLPLAWRDLLPNSIWSVLTELSLFFRDICATEISVDHISSLEKSSVETICKLEKIFPPGFFDSMEHLVIHLAYEARVGGPVQYRWMYPFERYMHSLKKKVKNKARVEGSIVEAYILEEISNFSRHYFNPSVQTKMTQVGRNDDGGAEGSGREISIFAYPAREFGHEVRRTLSDTELRQAETYVLLNYKEIDPYVL